MVTNTGSAKIAAPNGLGAPSQPVDAGGDRPHFRSALDDSQAALRHAAELIAAVEADIPALWRRTIDAGERRLSNRLVELSQAVRRAALVLGPEPAPEVSERSPTARVALSLPALEVAVARDGDEAVVWLRGSITASTSPILALALATLLGDAVSAVVIDLSSVTMVAADRVWVIEEAARLFRSRGTGLCVRNPTATVQCQLEAAQSTVDLLVVMDDDAADINHASGRTGALGTWVEVTATRPAGRADGREDLPQPVRDLGHAFGRDFSSRHAPTQP